MSDQLPAVLPAEDLGRVHFVGIGGAGMSGIARIMLARGLPVSGSDASGGPGVTSSTIRRTSPAKKSSSSGTYPAFAAAFASCGFRREAFLPCYGLAESTLLVSGGPAATRPVIISLASAPLERDRIVPSPAEAPGARTLVGFENHAGRTQLGPGTPPLGRVVHGNGNDGESGFEGVHDGTVIGTYVHGPLLPKNPWLADRLIEQALARQGETEPLEPLDDDLELEAHRVAERIAAR